jgi:hypothetical protein
MNDNDEDFSKTPVSITEIKAYRPEATASTWTPRDVLIDVLRRIDRGDIKPHALVVTYCEKDERGDGICTHFAQSAPDATTSLGLLTRTLWLINQGAYVDEH